MVKAILLVCFSTLLAKSALSQCLGGPIGRPYDLGLAGPLPYGGYGGYGGCGIPGPDLALANSLGASYGGGLVVTSSSPIAPTGLVVTSENLIEGVLSLGGNLPFLGAVTMEGVFPSAGAGSVSYVCGDGYVGIVGELPYASPAYGPVAAPAPYGPTVAAPLPYGPALAAPLPYGPAVASPLPYGPAVAGPLPYGPGVAPVGYGPGLLDYGVAPYGGCGYGAIY